MSPINYSCPSCDRPTLIATPDSVVDYECGVCGELVREQEVAAR